LNIKRQQSPTAFGHVLRIPRLGWHFLAPVRAGVSLAPGQRQIAGWGHEGMSNPRAKLNQLIIIGIFQRRGRGLQKCTRDRCKIAAPGGRSFSRRRR